MCQEPCSICAAFLCLDINMKRRKRQYTAETFIHGLDYDTCESRLGMKGSCGCIRVQRRLTPENVNAKWLYDNLRRKPFTKVIIWDDSGR